MPIRRPESQAERAHAFGARVRSVRRAKKLTQRQVAERIPMSPGNLSRLENGEHGQPADEVISKLAAILDMTRASCSSSPGETLAEPHSRARCLASRHSYAAKCARVSSEWTPRSRRLLSSPRSLKPSLLTAGRALH